MRERCWAGEGLCRGGRPCVPAEGGESSAIGGEQDATDELVMGTDVHVVAGGAHVVKHDLAIGVADRKLLFDLLEGDHVIVPDCRGQAAGGRRGGAD